MSSVTSADLRTAQTPDLCPDVLDDQNGGGCRESAGRISDPL